MNRRHLPLAIATVVVVLTMVACTAMLIAAMADVNTNLTAVITAVEMLQH